MSAMRDALRDYLAMRRALGFKLVSDGAGLLSFVAFLEEAQAEYISTALALAWAQIPTSVQPARWARRLGFVRGFARYCAAIDPRTEMITRWPPAIRISAASALLLLGQRHRSPPACRLGAASQGRLGEPYLSLPARPAQCHRPADFRGGQSHAGRCRFGRRHPDHPFLQVREVPNGSAALFHRDGAGRLPGTAGPLPGRPAGSILVRQ